MFWIWSLNIIDQGKDKGVYLWLIIVSLSTEQDLCTVGEQIALLKTGQCMGNLRVEKMEQDQEHSCWLEIFVHTVVRSLPFNILLLETHFLLKKFFPTRKLLKLKKGTLKEWCQEIIFLFLFSLWKRLDICSTNVHALRIHLLPC